MKQMQIHNSTDIIADIKQIIEQARKQAYTSINTLMIQSNWLVGRRIVEEEQGGASRAEYGSCTSQGQFGSTVVSTFTITNNSQTSKSFSFSNIPDGIKFSKNNESVKSGETINIDVTFVCPGPSVSNSLQYVVLNDGGGKPCQWVWIWNWDKISSSSRNVAGNGTWYYVDCSHVVRLNLDGKSYDIPLTFESFVNIRNE